VKMRISDHVLEILSANNFWMKGTASCIRHEEDKKKIEILNMIISHDVF
jgi:hypothetical protein